MKTLHCDTNKEIIITGCILSEIVEKETIKSTDIKSEKWTHIVLKMGSIGERKQRSSSYNASCPKVLQAFRKMNENENKNLNVLKTYSCGDGGDHRVDKSPLCRISCSFSCGRSR